MAVKAFRSLTFILFLACSVVTLTGTVGISTVVASCGSSGSTSGDPDSPKDTGPRPSAFQAAHATSSVAGASILEPRGASASDIVQWMVVQQLLSSMLGRPGLVR
jgi:hypothetical protein